MYKESLSVYREVGDRHGEADAMANIGSIAHRLGDFKMAERYYRDHVRIANQIGVPMADWFVNRGYTDPDAEWDFPPESE